MNLQNDYAVLNTNLSTIAYANQSIASTAKAIQRELELQSIDAMYDSIQLKKLSEEFIQFRIDYNLQMKIQNDTLKSIEFALKNPNQTESEELYEFGTKLNGYGEREKAFEYYQKTIELNPLHFRAHVALAICYLELGNIEESLMYAEKSLKRAPKTEEFDYKALSYQLIGRINYKAGEYDKAADALLAASNLDNDHRLTFELARYFFLSDRIADGQKKLLKAIEEEPHTYFDLALIDPALHKHTKELEDVLEKSKRKKAGEVEFDISCWENIRYPQLETDVLTNANKAKNFELVTSDLINTYYQPALNSIKTFLESENRQISDRIQEIKDAYNEQTFYGFLTSIEKSDELWDFMGKIKNRVIALADEDPEIVKVIGEYKSRKCKIEGSEHSIDLYTSLMWKSEDEVRGISKVFSSYGRSKANEIKEYKQKIKENKRKKEQLEREHPIYLALNNQLVNNINCLSDVYYKNTKTRFNEKADELNNA